jgi:hypothetical protein
MIGDILIRERANIAPLVDGGSRLEFEAGRREGRIMTPNYLSLNSQRTLRVTFIVVAFLTVVLGGATYALAQGGDASITIIGDGSLAMQSKVPWTSFSTGSYSRSHPQATKSVTKVEVTTRGSNHAFTYGGEQCSVMLLYENTNVVFATGDDGKKLRVETDWNSFHQAGADTTLLVHNHFGTSMRHVTVMKGGHNVLDSNASGHTSIVIHYE